MIRSAAAGLVAASAFLFAACTDPTCTERDQVFTQTVDGGPAGQAPVVHFELSQTFKTYGPAGCSGEPFQPVGVVTATVTSLVDVSSMVEYHLQGLSTAGGTAWDQPGVLAHIHPGETIDLGEVAVSTVRLSAGARALVTAVAPLPIARDDGLSVNVGGYVSADLKASNAGGGVDLLDDPPVPFLSFGGGALGGSVTDHAAGTTVPFAGGSLSIDAAGILTLASPQTPGIFSLKYRVGSGSRTSDATVVITVTP